MGPQRQAHPLRDAGWDSCARGLDLRYGCGEGAQGWRGPHPGHLAGWRQSSLRHKPLKGEWNVLDPFWRHVLLPCPHLQGSPEPKWYPVGVPLLFPEEAGVPPAQKRECQSRSPHPSKPGSLCAPGLPGNQVFTEEGFVQTLSGALYV